MLKNKKIKALTLFTASMSATMLFAAVGDLPDKSVESARIVEIDKIIQKENLILDSLVDYIKETADITPTRAEIQAKYSLDYERFTNYRKTDCANDGTYCSDNVTGGITLEIDTINNLIKLGNALGDTSTLSTLELNQYKNSGEKHTSGIVASDYTYTKFPISDFDGLSSVITIATEAAADPNMIVSTTEPPTPCTDGTTWLKPNGDSEGSFEYHYCNSSTGQWNSQGTISGSTDGVEDSVLLLFYIDDGFVAETTYGKQGWRAQVETEDGWQYYRHNGTLWKPELGGGSSSVGQLIGEIANDIGDLLDRNEDHKWFNASSGSDVDVNALLGAGTVNFTRKADFWRASVATSIPNYNGGGNILANIYIAEDLTKLPSTETDGAIAYLTKNNNNAGFEGDHDHFEAVYHNGEWINVVYTLDDLVDIANKDFGKYWVIEVTGIFENQGYSIDATTNTHTYWEEDKGGLLDYIVVTKGDRTDLPLGLDSSRINLTATFDSYPAATLCSVVGGAGYDDGSCKNDAYTPSGVDSSYTYNGGNFKQWFHSLSGTKLTNNLTDSYSRFIDGVTDAYYTSNNKLYDVGGGGDAEFRFYADSNGDICLESLSPNSKRCLSFDIDNQSFVNSFASADYISNGYMYDATAGGTANLRFEAESGQMCLSSVNPESKKCIGFNSGTQSLTDCYENSYFTTYQTIVDFIFGDYEATLDMKYFIENNEVCLQSNNPIIKKCVKLSR